MPGADASVFHAAGVIPLGGLTRPMFYCCSGIICRHLTPGMPVLGNKVQRSTVGAEVERSLAVQLKRRGWTSGAVKQPNGTQESTKVWEPSATAHRVNPAEVESSGDRVRVGAADHSDQARGLLNTSRTETSPRLMPRRPGRSVMKTADLLRSSMVMIRLDCGKNSHQDCGINFSRYR